MESSIAVFLMRQLACELLPTNNVRLPVQLGIKGNVPSCSRHFQPTRQNPFQCAWKNVAVFTPRKNLVVPVVKHELI